MIAADSAIGFERDAKRECDDRRGTARQQLGEQVRSGPPKAGRTDLRDSAGLIVECLDAQTGTSADPSGSHPGTLS